MAGEEIPCETANLVAAFFGAALAESIQKRLEKNKPPITEIVIFFTLELEMQC